MSALEIICTLTSATRIIQITPMTDKKVWWAFSTFEMEPSEIDWLREMLSAKTIITRYSGASGAQYDYTWTADDRQAVTDMVNLYDLLVAASPEVREKALRN